MNPLISVAAAERLIAQALPGFGSESVALSRAAGRVLRQPVHAEREQPPFDRVMMDGIALRWQSSWPPLLSVAGAQLAGMHGLALTDPATCIETSTGAVLPEGCDCVVPVEQVQRVGNGYALAEHCQPERWQFVHRRGSDCPAGARVLPAGIRIGPVEMALLAANGLSTVEVAVRPSMAIVSTGDELAAVDAPLRPGQIRRSNDVALQTALAGAGLEGAGIYHVDDDPTRVEAMLARLLAEHAVLVLTGGVSMGQRDHVPACLAALQVRCVLHGVAQRPGKPMWFGLGPRGQAVFALPGNPVSSLVCLVRYVRPALTAAQGLATSPTHARILGDAGAPIGLTRFVPAHLQWQADGGLWARPVSWRNSGDFTMLAGTDGVLELPPAGETVHAPGLARFHRW